MLRNASYFCCTELMLLLRRSHEWLYPIGFFLIVICLFPLALTPDPIQLQKLIPGCIWIAALLASLLASETIFQSDLEDGYIEQLLLSETPLALLLFAKLLAHWLVSEFPLILLIPLLSLIFHLPIHTMQMLTISLLLGTPILTLLNSLCVALTLGLQQQGVLMGLLILPLATPVLIFGVNLVQQAQAGLNVEGPVAFLAGLTILTAVTIPFAIAATVRISLDN